MAFEEILLVVALLATLLLLLLQGTKKLQHARNRFVQNRAVQERIQKDNENLAYDTLLKLPPKEIITLWKKRELSLSAVLAGLAGKGVVVHSVLDDVTDALDDLDITVRLDVLAVLEAAGIYAAEYLDRIIPLLRDNDRRIRIAASGVVAAIGPDAHHALPSLIDLLYARNLDVRIEAVRALGSLRLWDATLPHFETILQKDNEELVQEVCWALEKADDTLDLIIARLLPVFKKIPGSLDPGLISQCNPEIVGPFLLENIHSEERKLRLQCLKALGECEVKIDDASMDYISNLLDSGDPEIIGAAVRIIRNHPGEKGLRRLKLLLDEISEGITEAFSSENIEEIDGALRLISEFQMSNEEFHPHIVAMLEQENDRLRGAALLALINYKDAATYPLLAPLVKDESPLVRATLAAVLAAVYSDGNSLAPFLALLRDRDSTVRAASSRSLGSLRQLTPLVRTHFLAALDDTSREVRREAALGLAFFEELEPRVLERCIDEMRQMVIEGVRADRERAREALHATGTDEARKAAAIGLSKTAD